MAEKISVSKLSHHEKQELCQTRPPYRQGKRLTAIKVYTINDESQHLMICGVPKLQLSEEVKRLVSPYGNVKKVQTVLDYPTEEFTEAYHIHYARIQSARIAKRFIDGKNFFGGLLHVFYTPELESLSETRAKLIQRRKDVSTRIRRHREDPTNPEIDPFIPKEQYQRKKKTPALPLTEERLVQSYPGETLATIYDGVPRDIDPRPISEPSLPAQWLNARDTQLKPATELLRAPYHPSDAVMRSAGIRESKLIPNELKRKNYKGQAVNEKAKVKIVRPRIIDTTGLAKAETSTKKDVFVNAKKVESGITIKLSPQTNEGKKRIVIKNPSITQLVQSTKDLNASIQETKSRIRDVMQKL